MNKLKILLTRYLGFFGGKLLEFQWSQKFERIRYKKIYKMVLKYQRYNVLEKA